MTDRELLEFAAKAAGLEVIADAGERGLWISDFEDEWNPLTDDGDALRLAVKLGMEINRVESMLKTMVWFNRKECIVEFDGSNNDDPFSTTRRAIVRAAAEIGKAIDD